MDVTPADEGASVPSESPEAASLKDAVILRWIMNYGNGFDH